MHSRVSLMFVRLYSASRTRLPELDFTKPKSDRLKKVVRREGFTSVFSSIALRGQCLFGLHPIELALKVKRRQFYRLFLSHTSDEHRPQMQEIQRLADELSLPIEHTTTEILDRLAFDRPHQGACLDCSSLPCQDIQQIDAQAHTDRLSLDLCLVKVHDPMNFGAMMRTAHFFGVDRVILSQGTCQPSPVASKASSGALELMPMYTCHDLENYLTVLHQQGTIALICAAGQGKIPLRTLRLEDIVQAFSSSTLQRIVVLVGNEHQGLTEEIMQQCHYHVAIQPSGGSDISSLNVSVACALFLYHLSAQMNR